MESKADKLHVKISDTRQEMGGIAASIVCDKIKELLTAKEFVNIIFAAAPSQNEFLATLVGRKDIAWDCVNGFHMDEYIGLPKAAPQRFGNFLKDGLFDLLPFHEVNYIDGNTLDLQAECNRYTELLKEFQPDIVCMGIGENGHVAFNDPHVADFDDSLAVKIVDLDHECRQQQVNDGCFASLEDVPTHAITLTIPALMAGRFVYCMVPGRNKAKAVEQALNGEISKECPASILRRHPDAVLFLDRDSSSLIKF